MTGSQTGLSSAPPVSEADLIRDGFLPPETAEVRFLRRRLEALALYAEERLTPGDTTAPAVAFDAIAKAARDALDKTGDKP